jgi:8-oxo-dGTP pyrophosphatase MutT (NUDIX family)
VTHDLVATTRVDDIRSVLRGATRDRLDWQGFGRAAVLVPVLDAPDGPALLFTVRSDDVPHHPGQVAFPGGRLAQGEDVVSAALRETYEEVGLVVDRDDVLGELDDHPSPAGLIATPVVARVDWPASLELQRSEVAATFVVSVATLARTPVRWEDRVTRGIARRLHWYDVGEHSIWGLTGNVMHDLLGRLAGRARARGSS